MVAYTTLCKNNAIKNALRFLGHGLFIFSYFNLSSRFHYLIIVDSSLLILYNVWFKVILLAHWPIVLFVYVCALLQCEWMYCVVSIHCIYFLCCVTNHIIVSCWIRREKRLSSPGCLDVPRMYVYTYGGGIPFSIFLKVWNKRKEKSHWPIWFQRDTKAFRMFSIDI